MTDYLRCYMYGECKGDKCYGCKEYIDSNFDKVTELLDKFKSVVAEASAQRKQLKEERNEKSK